MCLTVHLNKSLSSLNKAFYTGNDFKFSFEIAKNVLCDIKQAFLMIGLRDEFHEI